MRQSPDPTSERDQLIAAQVALRDLVEAAEAAEAAAREAIHQRNLGICAGYASGLKPGTVQTITRLSSTRLGQIVREYCPDVRDRPAAGSK